ncbi:MAG: oligosaccharide flippase family protein [Nitrosomonadales bacterium]|nr:oligosaccharide flippase family protein [Nitrosomonadales bacterium]
MNHKQDHTELVQRILTGARWATLLRLSAQIFSWLSTIIVVRFISPEDYGLNAMLESPLSLMLLLSTLGLDWALVQAKKVEPEELQSIFGWLLILNGILFLAYFFGGAVLAAYFKEPRLDMLAKALAFVFILVPFRVIPNALLDRQLDFKLRAQLEMAATVAAVMSTLTLAYLGAGVWALVSGVIVNRLLLAILLMIFKPWFIVPKFNLAVTGQMIFTGGILTVNIAFFLLSEQLASLIAGPQLGAALLGIYAISAQMASLPLAKGMPVINQTMVPAFSKFQEQRASATYYLEKLLGVASLVFIPMFVGMSCVVDNLVIAIFGVKWATSILPMAIMSLAMIFRMNNLLLRTAMIGMGRAEMSMASSFLQLIMLLPMTFYAVGYGVTGLASAWVVNEFLVMIATIQLSKSTFDTTFIRLFRCYRPALISSAIMGGCVIVSKILLGGQSDMAVLLTATLTGAVSYYLAARFLFVNELHTALKTAFGNRFAFLTASPTRIK